ncbi:hypothetical protein KKA00_09940, partial [bacterium]|nr:hypothetical protein [bacterium]
MNPRNSVVLCLLGIVLLGGCAQQKKSLNFKFYMFGEDPAHRIDAPVLREREIPTRVAFISDPPGASVYAYNSETQKR